MAISAKELSKNHTDKERFAAASSCIATEILTLLFARKRRRSTGPVLHQPPRSRSRRVPDLKVPINSNKSLTNLLNLFEKTSTINLYHTRSSTSGTFHVKSLKLEIDKNSFSRFGVKLWNETLSY